MIKNYIKFNESLKYPYEKVYFEINSMEDYNKICDYLDSILGFGVIRINRIITIFPNYLGLFTNIDDLRQRKLVYYSNCLFTDVEFKNVTNRYGYDPVTLKMKDLKVLNSIIFKGRKIPIVNYNEPKKLVYEGIKHLLVGPTKEEVWDNYKHLDDEQLLKLSSKNGFIDGVKKSINNGVDIECNYGFALCNASNGGYYDIVKLLLDNGASVGGYKNEYYSLALACEKGYLNIVKLLVEHGSDVNAEVGNPLKCASYNGHMDIVKYLLEKGANPFIKSNYYYGKKIRKMTAADWAKKGEYFDIEKYLRKIMEDYEN